MDNSGLIYWWKRLNSCEQVKRANFSTSDACKVRGPEDVVGFDVVGRVLERDDGWRQVFGGLESVAGGGADFFGAFGLGGERTRTGFGGSRPWIIKIKYWKY